ncbi:MAG: IS1380 family transposase, partial [Micropruina sp.]
MRRRHLPSQEGLLVSETFYAVRPVFDDPNLVSVAGLVPALRLAQSAGFYDLLDGLSVRSPKRCREDASVVGGMLAGAD